MAKASVILTFATMAMKMTSISSCKCNIERVPSDFEGCLSRMQGLREIMSTITSRGTLCTGGKATILPAPGLEIKGVGPIAFPLLPSQIEVIKQVAKAAPFGKGFQSVIDATVRKTLQIEPSLIRMTNPLWHDSVQKLAKIAADELGVQAECVQAHLYKLLIYEQGGHFKGHKDIEKEIGMFATLVVQFPSEFCGGSLLFCHDGASMVLQMGSDDGSSKFDFHYAAHYADCQHEIREITSGTRMVAVYNLCWKGEGPSPQPTAESTDTAIALSRHLNNITGINGVLLEHQYTGSSLARYGIRALKGNDRAIADAVVAANDFMQDLTGTSPLVLHIVRSKRIIMMEEDGHLTPPELDLQEGSMFCLDGAEPQEKAWVCHKSFQFYNDIVNREFDDDECYSSPRPNDRFWKDCEGGAVEIYGNEGHDKPTIYSCYVLTFFRKQHEFQLLCKGDIGLAIAQVPNVIGRNKEQVNRVFHHLLETIKQYLAGQPCISLDACARGLEALLKMELRDHIQAIAVSIMESLTRTLQVQIREEPCYYPLDTEEEILIFRRLITTISQIVFRVGWDGMSKAACEFLSACQESKGTRTLPGRLDMLLRIFPLISDKSICNQHLEDFIRNYKKARSSECVNHVGGCRTALELLFLFDNAWLVSQLKNAVKLGHGHPSFDLALQKALHMMHKDAQKFDGRIDEQIDAVHVAWKAASMGIS